MATIRRVFGTPDLNQVQNNIAEVVEPLSRKEIISGLLLRGVELAVGDNFVNHRLNRELIGWEIVRLRAAVSIYDKQDTNSNSHVTLSLNASAAVTVDLWVF